jgi:threonine dehydrogenase-like Zn-dependent dehydrogenase
MFAGKGLVFGAPHRCELEQVELDEAALQPGELIVQNECTMVSAGTEVANFTGLDPGTRTPGSWNTYPHRPGYGGIGLVVALGPELPGEPWKHAVGDRVFAITKHAHYSVADAARRPVVPVREDDDARSLVLARMASVSISALRKASCVELGGRAVVVGLGLVGIFAAQLLQLGGMQVLGLDRSEPRVKMAEGTGVSALAVGVPPERDAVVAAFGGHRPDLVVEATGVPDVAAIAVSLARDGGEVVLLGTPRGEYHGDATSLLAEIHHRGLRLIGALEWLLPLRSGTWEARWSLQEDYRVLFDSLRSGRLLTAGLVSDVALPDQAPAMYAKLAAEGPSMGAVLINWVGHP